MQMTMICCPFKTSYGSYASSLMAAIERKTGSKVSWVASNCGCGDAVETSRDFQAQQCDYFEMPIIGEYRPKAAWKRRLRRIARNAILYVRAQKYAKLSKDAKIVHFQQILNAYGSNVVFHWLRRPSNATRVVTVHELDREQLEYPERNRTYDLADGIIVHCEEMRKHLIELKVPQEKVYVVLQGATIPAIMPDVQRAGIIFYAGHKVMTGKGIQTLFQAMSIMQQRMGTNAPTLKIHGHYGESTPEEGRRLAEECGVAKNIVWLNQLAVGDIIRQYQSSLVCVLPYTGSFAGLPASIAAANQLPVVCTKKAGLPDHLGECGVWVEEENPKQLAEQIMELLGNDRLRQGVAANLLKRAEEFLQWDVVADRTLNIYEESTKRKAKGQQKQ